jgi:hypothetical protein
MTFREARLSLQLLVEQRIGAPRYRAAREARDAEDAAWSAAVGKVN